jgi:membrane protein required for colicin V production
MNAIDIAIIIITFISCIISVIRGLFKEVISLASWVFAFILSTKYASELSEYLFSSIGNKTVSFAISVLTIFVLVLIIGITINMLFGFIITKIGFGPFDKVLGIVFGFLRAVIIVCVLIFIGMLTDFRKHELWVKSSLIPNYMQVIDWLGMDDMIDIDEIQKKNLELIKSI